MVCNEYVTQMFYQKSTYWITFVQTRTAKLTRIHTQLQTRIFTFQKNFSLLTFYQTCVACYPGYVFSLSYIYMQLALGPRPISTSSKNNVAIPFTITNISCIKDARDSMQTCFVKKDFIFVFLFYSIRKHVDWMTVHQYMRSHVCKQIITYATIQTTLRSCLLSATIGNKLQSRSSTQNRCNCIRV